MKKHRNISSVLSLVLRGLALSLGAGWLVLCIVVPVLLLSPTARQHTIIPLPVAPVFSPTATPSSDSDAPPSLAGSESSTAAALSLPTTRETSISTATATPAASATATTPTQTPTPHVVGYSAYTLIPGEDINHIAHTAGSDARSIMRYNQLEHLETLPLAGRPLIVPHLHGQVNTLPSRTSLVGRGRTDQPWVALTLDAGAGSAPVPAILAALRERDTRITFFLTGTWIAENPDLARQIVADGHEVANHSLTHPDFTTLSAEQMIQELARTEHLMQEITGTSTRPFFRPPFGAYNDHVLLTVIEQGYLPIYWTLDSLDSVGEPKTPEFLLERVTGALSPEELPGAIILAHCGSEATAEALPAILDRFAAMGLEVRTLSEVLGQ